METCLNIPLETCSRAPPNAGEGVTMPMHEDLDQRTILSSVAVRSCAPVGDSS